MRTPRIWDELNDALTEEQPGPRLSDYGIDVESELSEAPLGPNRGPNKMGRPGRNPMSAPREVQKASKGQQFKNLIVLRGKLDHMTAALDEFVARTHEYEAKKDVKELLDVIAAEAKKLSDYAKKASQSGKG